MVSRAELDVTEPIFSALVFAMPLKRAREGREGGSLFVEKFECNTSAPLLCWWPSQGPFACDSSSGSKGKKFWPLRSKLGHQRRRTILLSGFQVEVRPISSFTVAGCHCALDTIMHWTYTTYWTLMRIWHMRVLLFYNMKLTNKGNREASFCQQYSCWSRGASWWYQINAFPI